MNLRHFILIFSIAAVGWGTGCRKAPSPATHAVTKPPMPTDEPEDLHHRHAWWRAMRANAGPTSFASGRMRWSSLPKDAAVSAALSPPRPRGLAPVGPVWTSLGPSPLDATPVLPNVGLSAGRATAVAVNPANTQIIYVGYALGGVWRSTDGGTTWAQVTPDSPTLAIGAILIDPGNPNTVYVGTGEGNLSGDAYFGQGLLKTTDGGATWTVLGAAQFSSSSFTQLGIDSASGNVYATTDYTFDGLGDPCFVTTTSAAGLWRSSDGGTTWMLLTQGSFQSFSVDFAAIPHVFLLSDAYYGLYSYNESTGATAAVPSPMPDSTTTPSLYGMALARSPSNTSRLVAGVGAYGAASTLYRSSNNGGTWTKVPGAPSFCGQQCNYDDVITFHSTVSDTVYLGGSGCPLWKGTSIFGTSPVWSAFSMPGKTCASGQSNWWQSAVHPDVHQIVLDPADTTVLYAVTDNGAVRGHNDGASWDRFANMPTLQFYGVCLDPNDPTRMFGGFQDNGVAMRSGSTTTWQGVSTGDGGHCLIHPTTPLNVLITTQEGYMLKATDGFANLNASSYVFDTNPNTCSQFQSCGDRAAFIIPLAADPNIPDAVYLGTQRLWASADFGSTWTPITGDLTGGTAGQTCQTSPGGDFLTALAVDSTGAILTGSAGGHVNLVAPFATTVTDLTKAPLPNRLVSAIAVDPANPQAIYLAFAGFNGATAGAPGHLFATANRGRTWFSIDPPQFDMPVYQVMTHPSRAGVLFASTDFGVMASPDKGGTWGQLGVGIPPATITTLAFHQSANMIVAGTHGRSAWELSFGGGPTIAQLNPSSGPATGGQTVTLQGTGFMGGVTVAFGGVSSSNVQVSSTTSAQILTPPHTVGLADVTLLNVDGSTVTAPAAYTYFAAPPTIGTINPNSGPTAGGTPVVITGSSFVTGLTVSFGGAASTVQSVAAGSITCKTPPGAAGPVDVVVQNPDGQTATSTSGYTYAEPPDAGSARPDAGANNPDGGSADSGSGQPADSGTSNAADSGVGNSHSGCGCSSSAAVPVVPGILGFVALRRRRRRLS